MEHQFGRANSDVGRFANLVGRSPRQIVSASVRTDASIARKTQLAPSDDHAHGDQGYDARRSSFGTVCHGVNRTEARHRIGRSKVSGVTLSPFAFALRSISFWLAAVVRRMPRTDFDTFGKNPIELGMQRLSGDFLALPLDLPATGGPI